MIKRVQNIIFLSTELFPVDSHSGEWLCEVDALASAMSKQISDGFPETDVCKVPIFSSCICSLPSALFFFSPRFSFQRRA